MEHTGEKFARGLRFSSGVEGTQVSDVQVCDTFHPVEGKVTGLAHESPVCNSGRENVRIERGKTKQYGRLVQPAPFSTSIIFLANVIGAEKCQRSLHLCGQGTTLIYFAIKFVGCNASFAQLRFPRRLTDERDSLCGNETNLVQGWETVLMSVSTKHFKGSDVIFHVRTSAMRWSLLTCGA